MSVTHEITGGLTHLSANPIWVKITASAPLLMHALMIRVTCAAVDGSPFVDEITPSGLVSEFNLSGMFAQPVDYDFEYPAIGKVKIRAPFVFVATIEIGESWKDVNGVRQETWTTPAENNQIRVLKGGLDDLTLKRLNQAGTNFADYYINAGRMLTHLPNNMKVSPRQMIKLWYLSRWIDDVEAELHMNVTQMTDSGPHEYVDEITEPFTLYSDGLYEWSINPISFGYNKEVTAQYPILSFKFWITKASDNSIISDIRNYVVDNKPYENELFAYNVNPFSGVDSLWFTGAQKFGANVESETAIVPLKKGATTKDASIKTTSSGKSRVWIVNTGSKPTAEIKNLLWFLESRQRWIVDQDDATRLIPVYVEGGETMLWDSLEDINNVELKLIEA